VSKEQIDLWLKIQRSNGPITRLIRGLAVPR
jgi:hypothetical protein